jgi:tetratricopeptide (TPR) repeat protein
VSWTFTRAELEAERDYAAARVEERPGKVSCARLGRAHRWLDEEAAALEAFRTGAICMKTQVLDLGRSDNASGWLEYGLLLRNAGDVEAASGAFARALEKLADALTVRGAELRYLLGLLPGAAPDGPVWEQGLNALATREGIEAAREAIVATLRREQGLPSYTAPAMTLWDLLEETFRVEADVSGAPVPDHRAMLERAGFWA